MTFDGLRRLAPAAQPQIIIVDFSEGAERPRTTEALAALGLSVPLQSEDVDVTVLVDLDVRQGDNVPRLFGALMAVLSIGVLVHLVLTGARAGRRELAMLRAFGITRRQAGAVVAWQATFVTAIPFAFAALVGAAAGSTLWLAYAGRLNVAPATVWFWRPVLAFFLVFLVAAIVLGLFAARSAARHPASALRTE